MVEETEPSIDFPDRPSLLSPATSSHKSSDASQRQTWSDRYGNGKTEDEQRQEMWRDFDSGWVMVSELVAATLVWGGIGWLVDSWLGFAPVLMSIGFVVGFSAGFYLIWARSSGRIGRPAVQEQATPEQTRPGRTPSP